MKHLRRLLVGLLIPTLILVAFAVSTVVAGGHNNKVALCHNTAGHGFVEISVSENALPAHLRHGDVTVDEYGDCP